MFDFKPLAAGTKLGPYTLGTPLGSGASAVVYRAVDGEGREHAVKVRRSGVVSLDRRFLREFEAMRALRLPGVVRVYEAGIHEDLMWFSMDLVDGKPFLEAVHVDDDVAGRVRRTVDLGQQMLQILASLHTAGFVHRDVKPSNVLVGSDGRVRVLDFGIARFFGDGDSTTGSDSGQVLGTVPFMAPEQLAGLPFDHRVDLFAAGLVLYESIDGARPRPSTPVGWIPRICLDRLAPLACKHKTVPRRLSSVIERLLAVDPDDRPDASAAAGELRRALSTDNTGDWPNPRWIELGEIPELDGCIGGNGYAPVQIIEGPIGSGRRRIAEQVHRQGVVQGVWPLHVHCRIDGVGAPVAELIAKLLAASDDASWRRDVVGGDGELLRRMWPALPLPGTGGSGPLPAMSEIAQAAARCLSRASVRRSLLVVVHNLDEIDDLTGQAIFRLAGCAGTRLGLLLLHETRWASARSRQLVANLASRNAGVRAVPPISEAHALAIGADLCPAAPPGVGVAGTPQQAVEAGLRALAAWRGEAYPEPDEGLWPLILRTSVPEAVLVRVGSGAVLNGPLVRREDGNVTIAGDHAWRVAASRLEDPRAAARRLASAWASEDGPQHDPGEVASLWLRAGDFQAAAGPVLAAAREAEAFGRYADARRWLIVLDALTPDPSAERAFEPWYVRAQVVLRTESGPPRTAFVEAAERAAQTPEDDQHAKILRAEYALRSGELRAALVASLRVASPAVALTTEIAVRALLVATEARFLLGHFDDARRELERARALLATHAEPLLEVQASNLLGDLLYRTGDLVACRKLLQETIRRAAETGYVRGAAFASARLGSVLRALGKRQEAEHQVRSARDAFHETADQDREAEVALDLAMLRAERGDAAGARRLADDALRRARGSTQDAVIDKAMRVALVVATLRADSSEALQALATVELSRDPEASAALVRWWRSRGDVDRALRVDPPPPDTWGAALWRVERARAALGAGDLAVAASEADSGLQVATRRGFAELATYARLVASVARPVDDEVWRALVSQASTSLYTEVFLGAIELDARRLHSRGDLDGARTRWRALKARSEELGYAPGVEEADGWLR